LEDRDSKFVEVQSGDDDSDGDLVKGKGNENEILLRGSWTEHFRMDNSVSK
jgi:hypothetical protein